MGVFSDLFGGGKRDPRFLTSEKIHHAVYEGTTSMLGESQRHALEEVLEQALRHGGVTRSRINGSMHKELRKLHQENVFSNMEYQSIMRWLRRGTDAV